MSPADDVPGSGRGSVERRLGIATLIMTVGVLLSRLTGHLREAIIVGLHGAGGTTDAYYAAFTLPDLLNYMLAGGALSIAFLPIFAEHLATGREDEGWRVFSVIATTMTTLLGALVVLGELFAPQVVPLLVPGFPPDRLELTVRLTRIVLPAQLAFYLGGLVQATLYARERFAAPALSPLAYNLATIVGGLLGMPLGVEGFAWGVLVGAFIGPLGIPLFVARRSLRFRFAFSIRDPGLLRFIVLSLPLMIGVSLLTVDQWISRWFASEMTGTITHLENARRLMQVPTAVLGQAAGMAALPFLARLEAAGQRQEMGRVLGLAMRGVLEVTMLAASWMTVAAVPIVLLVFGWGNNTAADVDQTALLLCLFAAGIPFWGIQGVAVRGFYARADTFTPMVVSTGVVALTLPVYWAMSRACGAQGLAASTSIGMGLTVLATLAALRWRGVPVAWRELLGTTVRGGVAAVLAGGAALGAVVGLERWLDPHRPLPAAALLLASGAAFGVVTLGLAGPLRLVTTRTLMQRVLGKVSRLRARRPVR